MFIRFFGDNFITNFVSDRQGLRHSWLGVAPRLIVRQESPDVIRIHSPHFFSDQTGPVRSFLNFNRLQLDLNDLDFLNVLLLVMALDSKS